MVWLFSGDDPGRAGVHRRSDSQVADFGRVETSPSCQKMTRPDRVPEARYDGRSDDGSEIALTSRVDKTAREGFVIQILSFEEWYSH